MCAFCTNILTYIFYNAGECDYDPGPYHVTLPAGQIEVPFNASINDDDVFENNEIFQLVVNQRILPNRISRAEPYSSTVTIMDDEKRKYFLPYNKNFGSKKVWQNSVLKHWQKTLANLRLTSRF